MTARLIEINHRQRKSTFHCPLTGVRVWEDGEETFETCTTPYFVFLMTAEGRRSNPFASTISGGWAWAGSHRLRK